MSDNLPYEEALLKQLEELPLPDEDRAWEDMRRRLDKGDDDGPPVIPPPSKGCGVYALLLVLTVCTGLWFLLDPVSWFRGGKKDFNKESVVEHRPSVISIDTTVVDYQPKQKKDQLPGGDKAKDTGSGPAGKTISIQSNIQNTRTKDSVSIHATLNAHNKYARSQAGRQQVNISSPAIDGDKEVTDVKKKGRQLTRPPTRKSTGKLKSIIANGDTDETSDTVIASRSVTGKTTEKLQPVDSITKIDSAKQVIPDTSKKKPPTKNDTTQAEKEVKEHKHFQVAAGIALQQLVPVAGQKSNPYNSLGRKSTFGDYIPSVYLRLYKENRWFIQTEFRYGAPQYTKNITFIQKKVIDTGISAVISTNASVKKTFYHQLPISFNYFITPDLSLGAGVVFNRFQSALVQQDIHQTSTVTQVDSTVSSGLLTQKKGDSNFVTTYMQALIEAQYRWRRLSVGARYSFGLQPYLKFKLSGGEERAEKNSSLQLFLRFEFWRSKKKE